MVLKDTHNPPLGDTARTKAMRIGVSVAGAVPFAGATIQTILTEIIPNVRAERVETYICFLQEQLDELKLKVALATPASLDLFEEGLWQSARAFTDERKQYIGQLIVSGLTDYKSEQHKVRHFLKLLNQMGDDEIIVLVSFLQQYRYIKSDKAKEFWEKHKNILGSHNKDVTTYRFALAKHLEALGLVSIKYEVDNDDVKICDRSITYQGKLLLKYIGIKEAND